jgi:hypothetical protein
VIDGALVLPDVIIGMIEASAIRKCLMLATQGPRIGDRRPKPQATNESLSAAY